MTLLKLEDGGLVARTEYACAFVDLDAHLEAAGREGRNAVCVRLPNDVDVRTLKGKLDEVGAVALHFPVFGDGRAYTQARLLRERLGFTGEIRATGDVLRDQALFMIRCGVDAFEIAEGADADGFREALVEFSYAYQAGADETVPVARLRGALAEAA